MSTLNRGLVAHYTFDDSDTSGSMLYDRSAYDNHGTLNGGVTTGQNGIVGEAYKFDASNDYVQVGDNDIFDGLNDITVSAWVKSSNFSQDGRILHKDGAWTTYFAASDSTLRFFNYQDSKSFNYSQNLPTDEWSHLTFVFEGDDSFRLYVDGEQKFSESTTTSSLGSSTSDLFIGIDDNLSTFSYEGEIDGARVYDRTLSESEINRLYQQRVSNELKLNDPVTSGFGPVGQKLWTPGMLRNQGLVLWLDRWNSPFETRTDGDTEYVREWGDLSGNGNDATQTTGSLQPVQELDWISFEPGSDAMKAPWTGSDASTLLVLHRASSTSEEAGVSISNISSENQLRGQRINGNKNDKSEAFDFGDNFDTVTSPYTQGTPLSGLSLTPLPGQAWSYYTDGEKVGDGTLSDTSGLDTVGVGALYRQSGLNASYGGDIAVVVALSKIATQSEIDKLFGWLAHAAKRELGITEPLSNLPQNHPYKNRAPFVSDA